MKFGILITAIHDSSVAPKQQLAEDRALVELADDLGFDTMYAGQHFLADEIRFYQPIPHLTYLSQFSPTMRLATGVSLLPLLNPVDVAEQVATLDALTDGRAIYGVGLGYSEMEYEAFGVARNSRIRRFEESIEVLRLIWSGKPIDHDGEFFHVHCPPPATRPVQDGGVPIWIGGQSEPAVRRAARLGDAWYAAPFPTHTELVALHDVWLAERQAHGLALDAEFPVRRDLMIADNRTQALELAHSRSRKRYAAYERWGLDANGDQSTSWAALAEEEIGQRWILGNPEECAAQLLDIADRSGMTEFVYKPHWAGMSHLEGMHQLERFGAEVMPLLAAQAPRLHGS